MHEHYEKMPVITDFRSVNVLTFYKLMHCIGFDIISHFQIDCIRNFPGTLPKKESRPVLSRMPKTMNISLPTKGSSTFKEIDEIDTHHINSLNNNAIQNNDKNVRKNVKAINRQRLEVVHQLIRKSKEIFPKISRKNKKQTHPRLEETRASVGISTVWCVLEFNHDVRMSVTSGALR